MGKRGPKPSENPSAATLAQRKWREANPDKVKKYTNKHAAKEKEKKYSSFENYILAQINNSGRRNYITKDELRQLWRAHVAKYGHKCAKTRRQFIIDGTLQHPYSPSPDQILPGLGYYSWNIQFTTLAYNKARSNFGDEVMVENARAIIENQDDGTMEAAATLMAMYHGAL